MSYFKKTYNYCITYSTNGGNPLSMSNLDLSAQIIYEDDLIPLEQMNHQEHGIISLLWMLTKRALKDSQYSSSKVKMHQKREKRKEKVKTLLDYLDNGNEAHSMKNGRLEIYGWLGERKELLTFFSVSIWEFISRITPFKLFFFSVNKFFTRKM